jgi:hypothetical protein
MDVKFMRGAAARRPAEEPTPERVLRPVSLLTVLDEVDRLKARVTKLEEALAKANA